MHHLPKLISIICFTILFANVSLHAGEIHDAAAAGDLDKVKALLEADPTLLESKDTRSQFLGNTPLISACWAPPTLSTQVEVANFLINMGANIHAKNDRGATPFYFASGNMELAQTLVDKGADVNVRAYGSYTPLMQAAFSGNLKAARFLIDNGADLNTRSQRGTVLHNLIADKRKSREAMVKLLVESGAKLEEFSFGNKELHLAVLQGSTDMVQTLIDLGVDVNQVNDYGHTALYYAARHGYRSKADLLIAAGADKSTRSEANYGKVPQLTKTLKDGEAYLWYLGGNTSPYTGYAVKTKEHLLIFNPSDINESSEAGLANGYLNPDELVDQEITVLITFKNYYGQSGPSVSELSKQLPGTNFVLNFKPDVDNDNKNDIQYKLASPNESFSLNGIKVHTIPAMRKAWFGDEGLGYLVEADDVKIFYPGLHAPGGNKASEIEKYRKEIDFLKPFVPVDIVILPITGRHIYFEYEPYLYLIDQLAPKAIYLIGDDLATEEHRKCLEVLKARNIPVHYPEGGIAMGERFHYLRD
jgi:ankyrin repeat protein